MHLITTVEQAKELADHLSSGTLAFDFEATSVDWAACQILGLGIANAHDEWYLALPEEELTDVLTGWFDSDQINLLAHNVKYDLHLLHRLGVFPPKIPIDTMGLAQLYNESTPLSLKKLAFHVFDRHPREWDKTFTDWPIEEQAAYCCDDARNTFDLGAWFLSHLSSDLKRYFFTFMHPLPFVGLSMENNGWALDAEAVTSYGEMLDIALDNMQTDICTFAPGLENPRSTQQVAAALEQLGAKWLQSEKTSTGKLSTRADVLERMVAEGPGDVAKLAQALLNYREKQKLSGYVTGNRGLIARLDDDGRIRPNWRIFGTFTGRWSCSNPNLQNIPKYREGEDYDVNPRDWFRASPGNKLVVADLSQAELRVLAGLSQDETLVSAFAAGQDIHRTTAAAIFRKPYDDVTDFERFVAKTTNFATVYGAGAYRISSVTGLSRDEANKILASFFKHYSGVERWRESIIAQARLHGVVHTHYGRPRRPLLLRMRELLSWPDMEEVEPGHDRLTLAGFNVELQKRGFTRHTLRSRSDVERTVEGLIERGERQAVNAVIQGTVGDVVNRGLARLVQQGIMVVGQIHDEIICEASQESAKDVARTVSNALQADINGVSLTADADIKDRWGEK